LTRAGPGKHKGIKPQRPGSLDGGGQGTAVHHDHFVHIPAHAPQENPCQGHGPIQSGVHNTGERISGGGKIRREHTGLEIPDGHRPHHTIT
jgi:hypothetical protein